MRRRKFFKTAGLATGGIIVAGTGYVAGPTALQKIKAEIKVRQSFDVASCAHPMDLRPVNQALINLVGQRLKAKQTDKPLVVLIGENHIVASNALAQTQSIDALTKEIDSGNLLAKLAVAVETHHDFLGKTLKREDNRFKEINNHVISNLKAQDIDGKNTLLTKLALEPSEELKVLRDHQYFYYLEQVRKGKLSFLYNDAARKYSHDYIETRVVNIGGQQHEIKGSVSIVASYLDFGDTFSNKMALKHISEEPTKGLRFAAPKAMTIRNTCMVENIKSHFQKTGCNVYVQNCGFAHAFGVQRAFDPLRLFDLYEYEEDLPYSESLHALFLKEGFDVLPIILPTKGGLRMVPDAAWSALKTYHKKSGQPAGIYVTGLNSNTFDPYGRIPAHELENKEKDFLQKCLEKSKSDIPNYNVDRSYLKQQLHLQAPQWVSHARSAPELN